MSAVNGIHTEIISEKGAGYDWFPPSGFNRPAEAQQGIGMGAVVAE